MSFTPQLEKGLKLFKGRIAKFSSNPAINKELCLLIDVVELDPQSNSQKPFRGHLWVDNGGKSPKIRKSSQGDYVLFYGVVYSYTTSNLKTQRGIHLKYPQCIKYSNTEIRGRHKFL